MPSESPAIVFFHLGRLPFYLQCAMESARAFNRNSKIYLVSDQQDGWPELDVKVVSLRETLHPRLEEFRRLYKHIASTKEQYERNCFERWFHIEQLMLNEGLDRVVYLDSDCLLFAAAAQLFRCLPEQRLSTSRRGGPACTFIDGSIARFLDLILHKFSDEEFLSSRRRMMREAQARGQMANLTDMDLLEIFTTTDPGGYVYPNDLPSGHLDHCINLADGMECIEIRHRKRKRKRVYWRKETEVIVPLFRDATTGNMVRALAIHYQSGAKRLIRRFNRVSGRPILPQWLRLRIFEWMHGGRGSSRL